MASETRLRLLDVGADGGIPQNWVGQPNVEMVLVEPRAHSAAHLRNLYPGVEVLECALSNETGTASLKVTHMPTCSSLREPDRKVLADFSVEPLFRVASREEVQVTRYDQVSQFQPDVVKIDVQGMEYEVIEGMGRFANEALCFVMEAHTRPLYRGERTLADLLELMLGKGFVLRVLAPSDNFDGELVEADVLFTKRRTAGNTERLDRIEEMYGLKSGPNAWALAVVPHFRDAEHVEA